MTEFTKDSKLSTGTRIRHRIERDPAWPIVKAVKNMLPKNVLGREMITKLKVYGTPDHPHAAQQPKPLPSES